MNMNSTIATFLCVDDDAATASHYPNLGTRYSPNERRIAYWKNILVSCATARRCMPKVRLQVFTNLQHPHKLSRADLGAVYRQLNPAYPEPFPTYFGGEFIGGRGAAWQVLQSGLQDVWLEIFKTSQQQSLRLPNGANLFDNDEYILNYVYNAHQIPITLANDFMRRVITLEGAHTVKRGDTEFSLWHLPLEKTRGMMLLLLQMMDPHSAFWHTSPNEFGTYLGQYVGIPKRVYDVPYTPRQRLERVVRAPIRWLRERYMRQRAQVAQRKA